MRGLLLTLASLVEEHGLQGAQASAVVAPGLQGRISSCCGAWALVVLGMWNLPGSEIETISLVLAGGILYH